MRNVNDIYARAIWTAGERLYCLLGGIAVRKAHFISYWNLTSFFFKQLQIARPMSSWIHALAAEVTIEHFATVTSTMELHICLVYVGKYAVVKFVKLVSKIVNFFFLPHVHEGRGGYRNSIRGVSDMNNQ